MPCYRCGTRQVDPDRISGPWRRGVRADRQVLICPGCQDAFDWAGDLDSCATCASAHLVRRLGEIECRDCGAVSEATGQSPPDAVPAGLADEVEQALARVLRRDGGPARIS